MRAYLLKFIEFFLKLFYIVELAIIEEDAAMRFAIFVVELRKSEEEFTKRLEILSNHFRTVS